MNQNHKYENVLLPSSVLQNGVPERRRQTKRALQGLIRYIHVLYAEKFKRKSQSEAKLKPFR